MGARGLMRDWIVMVCLGLSLGWGVAPSVAVEAEMPAEPEPKVTEGQMRGEVSAVSREGISVEYARTKDSASEMYLPLDQDVEFTRLAGVSDLRPGDRVAVHYRQTYRDGPEDERVILNTVATHIALMRRAPEPGALMSTEGGEQP